MEDNIFAPKPNDKKGPWDVVVIGSGPSGLTSAIYTTRGALSTLIIGGEIWGGQLMLTTTVDNFPGFPDGIMGPALMTQMRNQAERFGAEFVGKNVSSIDVTKTPFEIKAGEETYTAKSIIIATGAETKWLDASGVQRLIGRGVSSCAPCDAPFFKNKKVVVVGGGDSAMEEALVLTKYAEEVTIVHRRNEFKASIAMQTKVLNDKKIKVIWNSEVAEVVGEQKVEKIIIKNTEDQSLSEIVADGLFIAIGHKPGSEAFRGIVETDDKGFIKRQGGSKTNIDGVFVAGDVHDHEYKQAITAAAFGCMAGMDAINYLQENKK